MRGCEHPGCDATGGEFQIVQATTPRRPVDLCRRHAQSAPRDLILDLASRPAPDPLPDPEPEQQSLPDAGRNRVEVASNAAPTSKAAAERVLPRSGTQRREILDLIDRKGGATDDEIEVALDYAHQSASARRRGLVVDGWVVDSGRTRPTRSGAEASVWVLSDAAIAAKVNA